MPVCPSLSYLRDTCFLLYETPTAQFLPRGSFFYRQILMVSFLLEGELNSRPFRPSLCLLLPNQPTL